MLDYLTRRSIQAAISFCVVAVAVFFATRLSGNAIDYIMPPGTDPVARAGMIRELGLDQSLWVQFVRYVLGLFKGDFGIAFYEGRPVLDIFMERLPNTIFLFCIALTVAVFVGVPLGIIAATKRGSLVSSLITAITFAGYATPNFVLAILLILVFSMKLHVLPSSGSATWLHFVLPSLVMSALMIAEIVRFTRNSMLDSLGQDYVRMALAKGMPTSSVILKHALRNAAIPVVTIIGMQIAGMVGRCVLVEAIFATRGVGDLVVNAAIARDYPVLQFGVMFMAALVLLTSIAVDAVYALLDPRVKVGAS